MPWPRQTWVDLRQVH